MDVATLQAVGTSVQQQTGGGAAKSPAAGGATASATPGGGADGGRKRSHDQAAGSGKGARNKQYKLSTLLELPFRTWLALLGFLIFNFE